MRKLIATRSQIYSEFFVGLAIAWAAGGVGLPFIASDFSLKGLTLATAGILGSFVSLQVAIQYRKRIKI